MPTYDDTGTTAAYASKMPNLANDANINEAIQAYHYGDPTLSTDVSFTSSWTDPAVGIIGKLLYLNGQIDTKIAKSELTAKGSLISASAASTLSILSVGTDGYVLKANSGTSSGLSWYSLDTTHLNLNPSSQTIVGDMLLSKATPVFRINGTSGIPAIKIDRATGTIGDIQFRTGTSARWILRTNGTAESGSNVGSDFSIKSYADDGTTLLFTPISIVRSTGAVDIPTLTVSGTLTASGTLTGTLTGNASTATALQTARTINGTSFDGTANITVTYVATLEDSLVKQYSDTASISSTSVTNLCTLATASYSSAEVTLTLTQSGNVTTSRVIIINDGTNVSHNQYGVTSTGTEITHTLSSDISGGTMRLRLQSSTAGANTITAKMAITAIKV